MIVLAVFSTIRCAYKMFSYFWWSTPISISFFRGCTFFYFFYFFYFFSFYVFSFFYFFLSFLSFLFFSFFSFFISPAWFFLSYLETRSNMKDSPNVLLAILSRRNWLVIPSFTWFSSCLETPLRWDSFRLSPMLNTILKLLVYWKILSCFPFYHSFFTYSSSIFVFVWALTSYCS